MNTKRVLFLGAAVALMASTAIVEARGPHHEEDDDAGSTKETAKKLTGSGKILSIMGALQGARGEDQGDFQDVYQVLITEEGLNEFRLFFSQTDDGFDTMLYLFDIDGRGLLANNDRQNEFGQESVLSELFGHSTDGTEVVLNQPGLYYIGISGFNSQPVSDIGHIFSFQNQFEVSGPDGKGGDLPWRAWTGNGQSATGSYHLELRGVDFIPIPAPGALALLGLAGFTKRRRRRR